MRKMRLAARTRPGDLGDDVRHVLLVQLNLDAIQRLVGQLPDFLCERHDDRGREVLLRLRANETEEPVSELETRKKARAVRRAYRAGRRHGRDGEQQSEAPQLGSKDLCGPEGPKVKISVEEPCGDDGSSSPSSSSSRTTSPTSLRPPH